MLYIDFCTAKTALSRYNNFILHPDQYFNYNFRPEWLEDKLVKDMVSDVDKSKVVSPYCIESPVFGQIPPRMLSGGVKTLILMLNLSNEITWSTACGDNCNKWIYEISKKKDLFIVAGHYLDLGHLPIDHDVKIMNFDKIVADRHDYTLTMLDAVGGME